MAACGIETPGVGKRRKVLTGKVDTNSSVVAGRARGKVPNRHDQIVDTGPVEILVRRLWVARGPRHPNVSSRTHGEAGRPTGIRAALIVERLHSILMGPDDVVHEGGLASAHRERGPLVPGDVIAGRAGNRRPANDDLASEVLGRLAGGGRQSAEIGHDLTAGIRISQSRRARLN